MDFPWNQPSYWGTPMTMESRIWDDRSVSRFPKHKLPNDLEYFVPSHDGMPLSKLKSIEGIGNIFSQPLGCPRLCRLWRIINCLKVSLVTSFEWPVTWGSKLNTTGRAPKHLTHRVPIYRFLEVNSERPWSSHSGLCCATFCNITSKLPLSQSCLVVGALPDRFLAHAFRVVQTRENPSLTPGSRCLVLDSNW